MNAVRRGIAAGALAIGLMTGGNADAASCSPSWLAGKWHVTFRNSFHSRSQDPVTIDAAGNMNGGVLINDGLGLFWGFRSITPIKVDTACNVTGQFGIFYGGPPSLKSYAFRARMSLDGLRFGYTAIMWPGYDNAALGDREIWISFEKAAQ